MNEQMVEPTSSEPAPHAGRTDEISQQLSALSDAVRQIAAAQSAVLQALQTDKPIPVTTEVSDDRIRRAVGGVMQEWTARQRGNDARERFVRHNMDDLPEAYRRLMPESGDATALARAEQDIRRQFREDLRSVLGSGKAVAGDDELLGERPGAAVDYGKLSPLQQITVGLGRSKSSARISGTTSKKEQPDDAALSSDQLPLGAD